MDRLYRGNAEDAQRIRAMTFDDVSDADSIDDETTCDGDCGEPTEGDLPSSEQTTSVEDCCTEVGAIDSCIDWKQQDEVT